MPDITEPGLKLAEKLLDRGRMFICVVGMVLIALSLGILKIFGADSVEPMHSVVLLVAGLLLVVLGVFFVARHGDTEADVRVDVPALKEKYGLKIVSCVLTTTPEISASGQSLIAKAWMTGTGPYKSVREQYIPLIVQNMPGVRDNWIINAVFEETLGGWEAKFNVTGTGRRKVDLYIVKKSMRYLIDYYFESHAYYFKNAPNVRPLPLKIDLPEPEFIKLGDAWVDLGDFPSRKSQ